MRLRLHSILETDWPSLAWIARCDRSNPVITVRHGPQVEARDEWLCEAVWDREFESGDFDRTDLVFGSGIRLRDRGIVFVPAGATVDRLQFLERDGTIWVSNSLACLLGVTGATVDPTYDRYFDFFWSVTKGLEGYERRVPTLEDRLEVVFFRNLVWDGQHLSEEDKPNPARDFRTFADYRSFLRESLVRIADNLEAAERNHRYEMVSGLSSGYDSTASTVLAHEAGLERSFSFRTARGGDRDDGDAIARQLRLELTLVGRTDWRNVPRSEIPYLAVNGAGQDIIFSSAHDVLRGRVLISGFEGDRVWARPTCHVARMADSLSRNTACNWVAFFFRCRPWALVRPATLKPSVMDQSSPRGTFRGTTPARSADGSWKRPESREKLSACTRRRLQITSEEARRY
jgi:hypothetical protein